MVKDVELFILLVIILICIVLILNARKFVKQKLKPTDENLYTNIVKVILLVVLALTFIAIYYII